MNMASAHSTYLDALRKIAALNFCSTCAANEWIGRTFKILRQNGEFPAKPGVTISVRFHLWEIIPL